MSAKAASILGKSSCHCAAKLSIAALFTVIFFTSSLYILSETCPSLSILAVTEGCVHHPDGSSDWPRLCQATLPSTHGALGNWLVLTQNTPHMGQEEMSKCYYLIM